jgi:hypothetical protein
VNDPVAALHAQVSALQAENAQLRQELQRIQQHTQAVADTRRALLSGGARLLVPLLDRQFVARSFGQLAMTAARFSGPREDWPTRDELLGETRTFLESCLRFVIRRRTVITFFSLLATAIPVIQVYLVMQQNQIIENQTRFAEMQVYDVVSRSMVDGNRNARLMTSALLARSDLDFLSGVVDEAFDEDLGVIAGREGVDARTRRLEDAAFRGHLIRAVNRGVQARVATESAGDLDEVAGPMFDAIVRDASDRVPVVLRLGEGETGMDGDTREQVDHYLLQVGVALRWSGRLARETGQEAAFAKKVAPLLSRTSKIDPSSSAFSDAYRFALQDFAADLGARPEFDAPPSSATAENVAAGIDWLRQQIGDEDVDWDRLRKQLAER